MPDFSAFAALRSSSRPEKLFAPWAGRGGEGMVVKPVDFIARDRRGLIQPALKTRGREPLRPVHECVFGVLALESQPVDPRL